jgi:hypothetical protein
MALINKPNLSLSRAYCLQHPSAIMSCSRCLFLKALITIAARDREPPARRRATLKPRHPAMLGRRSPMVLKALQVSILVYQEKLSQAHFRRPHRPASSYSTVTLFARFLGWSTSVPRRTAIWYASSCRGMAKRIGASHSLVVGRVNC